MGAMDDAALAAFLKRVAVSEVAEEGEDSVILLRRLLGQIAQTMIRQKFDAGRIKGRLLHMLERVSEMAVADWVEQLSEHAARVADDARLEVEEGAVAEASPWQGVRVKWYNRARGFGVLKAGDGTPDILVRQSVLDRCGVERLAPRQLMQVRVAVLDRGTEAVEIGYLAGFW
jgi:cold shock CspA family protein